MMGKCFCRGRVSIQSSVDYSGRGMEECTGKVSLSSSPRMIIKHARNTNRGRERGKDEMKRGGQGKHRGKDCLYTRKESISSQELFRERRLPYSEERGDGGERVR